MINNSTYFLPAQSGIYRHKRQIDWFADDGFMAGLVYSFLEGNNFRDSARFAMACAAISRASGSINNPTLSADNALSLVPMV